MLPEDVKLFMNLDEEYKFGMNTPRDKRPIQVAKNLDMYLDGEDIILRSPLAFRRNR